MPRQRSPGRLRPPTAGQRSPPTRWWAGDETTPANGGESCTWTAGPLTCTITGLTNGDSYIFGMSATNEVGTSVTSAIWGPVTPPSGDWVQSFSSRFSSPRATASEAWDPANWAADPLWRRVCSGLGVACARHERHLVLDGYNVDATGTKLQSTPLAKPHWHTTRQQGQLVLFGGIDANGDSLSSTWVWKRIELDFGISKIRAHRRDMELRSATTEPRTS